MGKGSRLGEVLGAQDEKGFSYFFYNYFALQSNNKHPIKTDSRHSNVQLDYISASSYIAKSL